MEGVGGETLVLRSAGRRRPKFAFPFMINRLWRGKARGRRQTCKVIVGGARRGFRHAESTDALS
jgi:hypothetical protein